MPKYIKSRLMHYFMFPENLISEWKKSAGSSNRSQLEETLRKAKDQVQKLESRRSKLLDTYLDGGIEKDVLNKKHDEIKDTIASLKSDIEEKERELAVWFALMTSYLPPSTSLSARLPVGRRNVQVFP